MSEIVLFYLAISSTKLYEWNCVVLFGYLQYKALLVELCCFIWLSPDYHQSISPDGNI